MTAAVPLDARWHLYRLLSDPFRLRVLALAAAEELALGELAELLHESQSNVSRHAAPLRQAGLLSERRQGTRTLVRLAREVEHDAVVSDAVLAGRKLCETDGSLARIAGVVKNRDQRTREFFAVPAQSDEPLRLAAELPAYLTALGALLEHRDLAVDAGTGDGPLLDVLAPTFRKVVAFDRSDAQLARAKRRVQARGYENVQLLAAELDDRALSDAVGAGADVVVASRVLHHAPLPRETLRLLAALLRPGGHLLLLDYARHADEALRDAQADVWMGFEPKELEDFALSAGLSGVRVSELAHGLVQNGLDGHLPWLLLAGRRPGVRQTHSR
ncbi:MAG TPA: methyltransferase domain-containing protein [Polyangiaceae bacterium]|jgi:ArsR family transcriptional regulator